MAKENSTKLQIEPTVKGRKPGLKSRITVPRNKPNQGGKRPVLGKLHNIEERN